MRHLRNVNKSYICFKTFIMLNKTDDWTYEHFITYIYTHAAMSDHEFTNIEKQLICARVGDALFDEIVAFYKTQTELQRETTIATLAQKFVVSEKHKRHLLEDLTTIFLTDENFEELEKQTLEKVKELL